MESSKQEEELNKVKRKTDSYLKYSGMATQLMVLIFVAVWIGKKIDGYFHTEKPWFTAGLVLFFFTGWFYQLYRDVSKP